MGNAPAHQRMAISGGMKCPMSMSWGVGVLSVGIAVVLKGKALETWGDDVLWCSGLLSVEHDVAGAASDESEESLR